MKQLLVIIVLAAIPFLGEPARAQSALAAYERGDFEAALRLYRAKAETGDADAQFHLGEMHLYAHGVERNPLSAIRWYERAASQNHPRAQSMLGTIYDSGWGVASDPEKAAKWYRRAAEAGDPWGMAGLGELYRDGRGVEPDPVEAMAWFHRAVRHGGRFYRDFRDELAATLTPEQARRAKVLAGQWKPSMGKASTNKTSTGKTAAIKPANKAVK